MKLSCVCVYRYARGRGVCVCVCVEGGEEEWVCFVFGTRVSGRAGEV